MTQWKSTARPSRSAPSARPAPPSSLPAFGAGSLSVGVVSVLVRPIASPEVAEVVGLVLWRIRGVGGVELVTVEDAAAEFAVTLLRPVALGSDLRSAFGRELLACRRDGERFLVEIHPPSAPAPAAAEAPLRSPLAGPRSAPDAASTAGGSSRRPSDTRVAGFPGPGIMPPWRSTAPGPGPAGDARAADGPDRGTPAGAAATTPEPTTGEGEVAPEAPRSGPARPAAGARRPAASSPRPESAPGPDAAPRAAWPAPDQTPGTGPAAIPRPSVDALWEAPGHAAATPQGLPDPVAAVYDALDGDDAISILVTGPEHVVRTALGGLHRHFGRAVEGEPVGRSLSELLPLGAQQALADRVSAAVRGTRSTFVVEDLPGGRVCEFLLHPVGLGGAVHGCAVVARDITRRRRQDQVVGELTSVFDATFDASYVGVGLVSPRGEWLRVNPALEQMLGRRGTSLLGMRVDDVTQVDDAAREARVRERAERTGDPSYEIEKRMIGSTGDVFVAQVRMTAIVQAGELRGWVANVAAADVVTQLESGGRPRGGVRRLGA